VEAFTYLSYGIFGAQHLFSLSPLKKTGGVATASERGGSSSENQFSFLSMLSRPDTIPLSRSSVNSLTVPVFMSGLILY